MSKEDLISSISWDGVSNLLTKTLIPSFITVLIGVSVEYNRTKRLSFLQVLVAIVVGMGTAYLFHESIHEHYPNNGDASIAVSFVTIVSYKGWELLIILINKTTIKDLLSFVKKWG